MNTIVINQMQPAQQQQQQKKQRLLREIRNREIAEHMTTSINSVKKIQNQINAADLQQQSNELYKQRYIGLRNAKKQYKEKIQAGKLEDGFDYIFGALPYELYGFNDDDTEIYSTTVDSFANLFKELYKFYLKKNQAEKGKTSLITFILKVSDFTNARLDPLGEFYEEFQGLLPYLLVQLLMDIIIKTGTFYDFNITPVDINVIMYNDKYFRSEIFTSLAHYLKIDLNQRKMDDFYSETG